MKSFKYLLALVTLLALLLGAFTGLAQDEKVLVIGWSENTDAYDPANGFTHSTHIINHVTYSQLVTFPDEDASRIVPSLAISSPAMRRSVVVLPQPEGPSSVTRVPGAISNCRSRTATTSP